MGGEASDRLAKPDAELRRAHSCDERAAMRVRALLGEVYRPGRCILCDRIRLADGGDVYFGGDLHVPLESQVWHLEHDN